MSLKFIFCGERFEKSFAGLTILAAILVASVEMIIPIMANETISLLVK